MPRLRGSGWWANPLLWTELFLVANLAFLAVDVFLAHAINITLKDGRLTFAHPAEWIPILFSVAATFLLLVAMGLGGVLPQRSESDGAGPARWRRRLARAIGLSVGWGAIVVGVAGQVYHLNGDFFQQQTLKNLVYTAPFAAPLAYTGLGFLLLLNRMVDARGSEWARWVVLLAAGGFVGNFILSLADHAQNGFFYVSEWTGVIAGAVATGFLIAVVVAPDSPGLLAFSALLMVAQVPVGLIGFYLHAAGNFSSPAGSLWDRFVFGAPVFAPLLFADLALLALLGLWAQAKVLARVRVRPREAEPAPAV